MSEFARNWAVVIGINNYGSGISPLQNAVNDAKKLIQILQEKHGYSVLEFLDEIADLKNLNHLLEKTLPPKVTADDRLLFYFAGHGIALNNDDGPEGYLIPQNAKLGDTNSYLPMTQLHECLSKLPCRHFLGILDCCFAGAFRWSSTRDLLTTPEVIHKERYERFIQDPAWQVITSAAYDQKALDAFNFNTKRGQVGNHSPFAAALLEALAGGADIYPPAANGKPAGDGVITATELYLYLRNRIEPAPQGHRYRQTPGIWPLNRHDKGEYIFLTPGHELNLPPAPPLDESQNPYRGLQSFEEEHSHLFFGRQALTEKLHKTVDKQTLTVVLGASGTGKSSLVKAGLIPYLKQLQAKSNQQQWHILTTMRPGKSPLKALNNTLTSAKLVATSITSLSTEQKLETFAGKLKAWSQQKPKSNLLLVIDQLEELVTLCQDDQERENFLDLLAQAVAQYPDNLRIVLTLRSDFEPQFQNTALKEYWQEARFIVSAMTREELRSCIEEPASARVMYFEPSFLVDQLIDEVAQMPGVLPLLSFTLSELYLKYLRSFREGKRDNRAITQEDYEELGGVTRSLTQRADFEYKELVKQDKAYAQTIRNVMLRMVVVGGGELALRRVPLSELEYPPVQSERVKEVIKRFSAARLLVEGQDTEGQPYVEPAHDALVRGWQKLLAWKQEDEESLILQRRLTPAAEEWANQPQPQGLLGNFDSLLDWLDRRIDCADNWFNHVKAKLLQLRRATPNTQERKTQQATQFLWNANPRLDLLKQLLKSSDNWFNQVETKFVQRSVRQKRQNTIWRWSIVTGVITILTVLTIFALIQRQTAIARQLTAQAQLRQNEKPSLLQLGTLLAVEATQQIPFLRTSSVQTDQALRQGIALLPRLIYQKNYYSIYKSDENAPTNAIAFTSDGRYVVTATDAIRVLEFSSGKEVVRINYEKKNLKAVTFSQNGKYVAVALKDNTVQVWELPSAKEVARQAYNANIEEIYLSPNGRYIAITENNTTLTEPKTQVWAISSYLSNLKLKTTNLPLFNGRWREDFDFSPGGNYVVVDSENNVQVWAIASGTQIAQMKRAQEKWSGSKPMAFSPDGRYFALGQGSTHDGSGIIQVWGLYSGEIRSIKVNGWPNSIALSLNGKYVTTGFRHEGFQIWDVSSGQEVASITRNGIDGPGYPFFSPDGKYLCIGENRFVRVYEVSSGREVTRITSLDDFAFSPDGKYLAVVDSDSDTGTTSVNVWEAISRPEVAPIQSKQIREIAFSPDKKTFAIVSENGVFVYETNTMQEIFKHEGHVNNTAFSQDGRYLASVGNDKTVQIWELANRQEVSRFTPVANDEYIIDIAFSPDGKYLTLLANENDARVAKVWDIISGQEVTSTYQWLDELRANGLDYGLRAKGISPDGKYLIVGHGGEERIDQLERTDRIFSVQEIFTGRKLAHVAINQKYIKEFVFSSDGKYLAGFGGLDSGTNPVSVAGVIQVWDISSGGEEIKLLVKLENGVSSTAFSPDGKYLAAAVADGSIRVWKLNNRQEIIRLQSSADSVLFSSDGKYLTAIKTSEETSTMQVWLRQPEDLVVEACKRLNRNLTSNEWQQYLGTGILPLDWFLYRIYMYRKTCPTLGMNEPTLVALENSTVY